MSLVRLILIAIAAFIVYRLVRALVRAFSSRQDAREEGQGVRGRKKTRPLEKPFRDAKDASFEDLTGSPDQPAQHDRPS